MSLRERSAGILSAVLREYIESGEPISSGRLYEKYEFGIRPATIRNELRELTDLGFLEQPYHSAGHAPSNQGYEFYAEELLAAHRPADRPYSKGADRLVNFFEREDWSNFLDMFTKELGLLGVLSDRASGLSHKDGLDDLVEHLDWDSPDTVKRVIRDCDTVEKRVGALIGAFDDDHENAIKIFIGQKSPITTSEELSVVAGEFGSRGRQVFFAAIGPKRMRYADVIRAFQQLQ